MKKNSITMKELRNEELAYKIIRFLKKWGMWNSITIYCNGKSYSDYWPDECTFGFRDLKDIRVGSAGSEVLESLWTFDECHHGMCLKKFPILTISCEGTKLNELLNDRVYYANIPELSDEAQKYVIEEDALIGFLEDSFAESPILDDTDFNSYDEYLSMELEIEDEEKYLAIQSMRDIMCSRIVVDAIIQEFEDLFQQYHIEYEPIGYFYGVACFEMDENAYGAYCSGHSIPQNA